MYIIVVGDIVIVSNKLLFYYLQQEVFVCVCVCVCAVYMHFISL